MSRSVFIHRRTQAFLSTDSFDRAGAIPLGSTYGTGSTDPVTWVKEFAYDSGGPHGLGISTNNVGNFGNDISTPHAYHIDTVQLGTADVSLSIDVAVSGAGKSAGVVFRVVDSNNFWYAALSATGPQIDLYKTVAGTGSLVGSSSTLGGLIGTVGVNVTGNSISVLFNQVVQVTTTDSFNSTATKHGIGIRNDPTGGIANGWGLDNWVADVYP